MGRSMLRPYKSKFARRVQNEAREKNRHGLAIGQHLPDGGDVARTNRRQLLELAHAAGGLETGKVALGSMPAQDLARGGDLEALAGAAVRLQFHFRFRSVAWHCENSLLG